MCAGDVCAEVLARVEIVTAEGACTVGMEADIMF
jgi:hypothetical protein